MTSGDNTWKNVYSYYIHAYFIYNIQFKQKVYFILMIRFTFITIILLLVLVWLLPEIYDREYMFQHSNMLFTCGCSHQKLKYRWALPSGWLLSVSG